MINLIIVSLIYFEPPIVHPQEEWDMQFYDISFWLIVWLHEWNNINWMYKSSWRWTLGGSKQVEDSVIKLKL
jgi:hypothetical protein